MEEETKNSGYFALTFPLILSEYQKHLLDKRIRIARFIYNQMNSDYQKFYKRLTSDREYKELSDQRRPLAKKRDKHQKNCEKLKEDLEESQPRSAERKEIQAKLNKEKATLEEVSKPLTEVNTKLNKIRSHYRFGKYDFTSYVAKYQHRFKKNIDNCAAQVIASTLQKSYDKLLFGNGKKVKFKRFDDLNLLGGKRQKQGIRYLDKQIIWGKERFKVDFRRLNDYEKEAFKNELKINNIIRKKFKGEYRFYANFVFKGIPPFKINKNTSEFKLKIGKGDVGIDIGTQTVAISSDSKVELRGLAENLNLLQAEKRILQRKMDRSRRITNPNCYNADGTAKKRARFKNSNRYKVLAKQFNEICRKQTQTRKVDHETLANEIIQLGDNFIVEKLEFKGMQQRSKKTEKNEDGRFKKKKRFGKSIGNRAPAAFLTILDRKLGYFGKSLTKIEKEKLKKIKPSQYNHITKEFIKVSLSDRWKDIGENKVQRDIYSAFLLSCVNGNLRKYNHKKIEKRWENFLEKHDFFLASFKNNSIIKTVL